MEERDVKRLLVLGSNSFTASYFIDYVLQHTDWNVVGVSRSPQYHSVFLPYLYRKPAPTRFRFFQLDVNRELNRFGSVCDEFEPDVVVNYAAQGEVRNSWNWPEQWYQTNCLGVVGVSEYLRKRDFLKRYVAISTPEVYGATGENIEETSSYCPSTPYAASKLAGDLHLLALHKRYGFPVVFTRAANLYGMHQQLYRVIPRTAIYLKLGRPVQLHGEGRALRSFIHARDVADCTYRAILSGRNGEVYHIAPDDDLRSIAEVVRFVCELRGCDFDRSVEMVKENFGQDNRFSISAAKAKRELKWKPEVGFEDGVREVISWIDENWDFIRRQPLDYVHQE